MKVKFNQAVHLDGKTYSRGVHDVPEKSLQHKFFHKMLKCGWVSDPEAPPIEVLTEAERVKRLAEKVMATASKAKPMAPPATPHSAPKPAEQPKTAPVEEPAEVVEANGDDGLDELGGADEFSEDNGEVPTPADDESAETEEAQASEAPALEPAEYAGKSKKSKKRK